MYKIKLHGLGGQGVVTAAKILSHAVSIHEDRFARTVPAFGHERRGAPVFADVMIDREQILLNSFIYEPDVVMLFAPSVMDQGIVIDKGIHPESILVVNTGDESLLEQLKNNFSFKDIYFVDATRVALDEIGRDIPNSAMLGALAGTGIVGIDSIAMALEENFKKGQGESNARAARSAYEKTQKK